MNSSEPFVLDRETARKNKRRRAIELNTRVVPRLRLLGFSFIGIYIFLWSMWVAPVFDSMRLAHLCVLLSGYGFASWWVLRRFYRPDGLVDLPFVMYNVDVLVFLAVFAYTGGEETWMTMFLITRVADQAEMSFARACYFAHFIVIAPLLLLAHLAFVQGVAVNWPEAGAILCMLYLAGLYIALTARTSERLRRRVRRAMGEARTSLTALHTKTEELKRNSAALAEARRRAQDANFAKSRFLANMSHEIRTPMNGIIGTAELLTRSSLTSHQQRYVNRILTSGNNLLSIINDILDLSKLEASKVELEKTPFDLKATLGQLVELHASGHASKPVALHFAYDELLPTVLLGDQVRISQVVGNLLSNALKFTHAGEVTVSAEACGGGRDVRISVSDTGIGIAAERTELVFDEFTQADSSTTRRYGGTGLGLAIVKQLVELMGGHVFVKSEPGQGSCFTLELPLEVPADLPAQEEVEVFEADRERTFPTARILVVDDNEVNREVAIDALLSLECPVDTADNGFEALEAIAATHYDLVFMDCQMPELDGIDATRALRQHELRADPAIGRRLPIVAMTANAMHGDRERCLEAGMDDYVSKPIHIDQFQHLARRWLEIAMDERQSSPSQARRASG